MKIQQMNKDKHCMNNLDFFARNISRQYIDIQDFMSDR